MVMSLGLLGAGEHEGKRAGPPGSGATQSPPTTFMKGITVSCPRYGQIWGSPHMTTALHALKALGARWIALHPYGSVYKNGRVSSVPPENTGYLTDAVRRTQNAGLSLFWKPHLAYWGSFPWRGAIDFRADSQAWKRFFEGYRRFILGHARFAQTHQIPVLAFGTELEGTMAQHEEWRSLLKAVRQVYSGTLTYAANWDRIQSVPFWPMLDAIGVQAYFPLSTDKMPTKAALKRAWDKRLQRLRHISAAHGQKPIIFTEIGYARAAQAAQKPWEPAVDNTKTARVLRQRLMEVALEAMAHEPLIRGAFWWKWIPGDDRFDRDFSMKDPEARAALRNHWATPPPSRKSAKTPSDADKHDAPSPKKPRQP